MNVQPSPQNSLPDRKAGTIPFIFTRATFNTIMTVNLLAAVLPLFFFIFFQNKIIKGISMSGLKG